MNKFSTIAPWAAASACVTAAQAQDQVQLYGTLDVGLARTNNSGGGSLKQVLTRHSPSYWGIRSNEDLGGGLRAFAQYERSIAVDTGVDGTRQSFVGLSSTSLGRISIGRQYDLMIDIVPTDPARYNSVTAVSAGNIDRSVGTYLDNSVVYRSPNFGHLRFALMHAFGENQQIDSDSSGADLIYQDDKLRLTAVYLKLRNNTVRPFGEFGLSSFLGTSGFANQPARTLAVDRDIYALGGWYNVGPVRMLANVTRTKVQPTAGGSTDHLTAVSVGGYTPVNQGFLYGVGLSRWSMADSRWQNVYGIVTYLFSARTEMYVRALHQSAKGPNQRAVLYLEAPSSTRGQTVIGAGITHKF